jgi:uncharacterized protein involved in exopolysaccharide biosynthesis
MDRTYTFEDLVAALRRRRALALLVFALVLAAGVALAILLPAEYTATSTVQLEPRRLSADFLPAQGIVPLEDRMRTLKHGIVARPVLERVLKETDFFPDLRDNLDEAVERLRRQTEVRLEGEVPGGPPALLFVVAVRGSDPRKVKAAADLLPRVYEESTRQLLSAQADSLVRTFQAQVEASSATLAAKENELLAFKQAHRNELPEASDANARAAGRAEALLEIRLGALLEAQRRRAALLGAIPEGGTAAGMSEGGVDAAARKLQAAEAAYGPNHPDVLRARRELKEAVARRDQDLDEFQKQRVQEGLARVDGEVREHQDAVATLRRELDVYARRADAVPEVGQQLAALTRDYDALKATYVGTVGRRDAAVAARSLLAADGPGLFQLIEPAAVPTATSAPDRGRLVLLAVLVALAVALGTAAAAEWLDGSTRGPEDASGHGVPVLAAIPRIGRA